MKRKLYQEIAALAEAHTNCILSRNSEWELKHAQRLARLADDFMPQGSGIDNGCKLDLDNSTGERLTFLVAYHAMDEHGSYCGWTDHKVVVKPSLAHGFTLKVTGSDKYGQKDYIADTIREALLIELDWNTQYPA